MHTIFSHRSIRSYTGEMPTDEELRQILKAVYAAPVGMGRCDSLYDAARWRWAERRKHTRSEWHRTDAS